MEVYNKEELAKKGYTKKQIEVICGEVDFNSVTGQMAYLLLSKATALQDDKVLELAKKLKALSSERRAQKNRDNALQRDRLLRQNKEIVWQQPKNANYTEHNKAVVRGEIPLDHVHTNELIRISQIAKLQGDVELSERLINIIMDRRTKAIVAKSKRRCYSRPALTAKDMEIIEFVHTHRELAARYLNDIIKFAKRGNDIEKVQLATTILDHLQNSEKVYATTNIEEAVDNIELLMMKPIRRPNTWFTEK